MDIPVLETKEKQKQRALARVLFDNYAKEQTDRLMRSMSDTSGDQVRVNNRRKLAEATEGFTPQESMRLEYDIPQSVYYYWKLVYGQDFDADNPDSWKLLQRIAARYKISPNKTPDKYLEPPKDDLIIYDKA